MSPRLILPLLAALMCLLGMMPGNSYSFYMLVRLVTCVAAIYAAVQVSRLNHPVVLWWMIGIAVLYNPVLRVHLTRDLWWWINGATAVLLCLAADKMRNAYLGR